MYMTVVFIVNIVILHYINNFLSLMKGLCVYSMCTYTRKYLGVFYCMPSRFMQPVVYNHVSIITLSNVDKKKKTKPSNV